MEATGGSGPWEFLASHPSDTTRRTRIQSWLPEAMIYYEDRSQPLPENLVEVRQAVAKRTATSNSAPVGLRPSREPGFWFKVQFSNRTSPTTFHLEQSQPCFGRECLVHTSDAGDRVVVTKDLEWVEATPANGPGIHFDPPLSVLHWPIHVGDTWSGDSTLEVSTGGKQQVRLKGDVVAYESVTVPAGSFMAFRVILSLNGTWFEEFWWAPEVPYSVRVVTSDGRGGKIFADLIDYQKSADPTGELAPKQ